MTSLRTVAAEYAVCQHRFRIQQYAEGQRCCCKCDDQEIAIDNPLVMADDQGNMYIELVNIYNTDLAALNYTMPKDSFSVTFTIKGMDSVLAA